MIAHRTMHVHDTGRTLFAAGRIPARVIDNLRELAARLRNTSTVALLGGDYDAAQVALAEAELLEFELGDMERRGIPVEALFLAYGSEWTA